MVWVMPVPLARAEPCAGLPLTDQMSVSPSGSVALSVRLNGVGLPSSLIVTLMGVLSVMTGASLTASTVTLTATVSLAMPSLTATVKTVVPDQLAGGV